MAQSSARASMLNTGPHGLSEVLYAYTSAGNNNGSAFAGLGVNTTWYNTSLGLAMLLGRFLPIVLVLGLAGRAGSTAPRPCHRQARYAPTSHSSSAWSRASPSSSSRSPSCPPSLSARSRRDCSDRRHHGSGSPEDPGPGSGTGRVGGGLLDPAPPAPRRCPTRCASSTRARSGATPSCSSSRSARSSPPSWPSPHPTVFAWSISVWLWLTVVFANLAEAVAEGPRQGPGRRPCAGPARTPRPAACRTGRRRRIRRA